MLMRFSVNGSFLFGCFVLEVGAEWHERFVVKYRVNTKHSLISSSYKIKTYWNILTKLVATVA